MMTNPHPMITPLSNLPPEEMAKKYSDPGMRKAYRILWNNTLAFMSSRPLVREHRSVYRTKSGVTLATCAVEVLDPGWLRFQKLEEEGLAPPVPPNSVPSEALSGDLDVLTVDIEENPSGVPTDVMIDWLAAHRVASPGTLASILARMMGAGWINWPDNGIITLTDSGARTLQKLDVAGYLINVIDVQQFRDMLQQHEESTASPMETATKAFLALGMTLDESVDWLLSAQIQDHRADETYAMNRIEDVQPPLISGYPSAIDPEQQLSETAPERKLRADIESRLFARFGDAWFSYSDRNRSIFRLFDYAQITGVPIQDLATQSCFDVKLRWLIGLPADMRGIQNTELKGSPREAGPLI